jgi:hypothetical protein
MKNKAVSTTEVCFRRKAQKYIVQIIPQDMPIVNDANVIRRNPNMISFKRALSTTASCRRCFIIVSKRTIETPSFKRDSPKTKVYRVSVCEIPELERMPKVATGSMEERRDPNTSESKRGNEVLESQTDDSQKVISPINIALITVPIMAKNRIGKRSLLKERLSMQRAA